MSSMWDKACCFNSWSSCTALSQMRFSSKDMPLIATFWPQRAAVSTADQHGGACRCLTQMGTQTESFVELTDRIGRKTGGVSVSPFTSSVRDRADPAAYLMISGKSTAANVGGMLELFRDILLTARLDDQARFKQVRSLLPGGVLCWASMGLCTQLGV